MATLAFVGFFAAILAQIAYRYLGISLVFSEELARLLNVWVVFLGLIAVTVRHDHIRVDLLDRTFGNSPATTFLYRVQLLLTALFLASVTWGAFHLTTSNWAYPLATLPIPRGAIFLAPCLGAGFGVMVSVLKLFEPVPALGEFEEVE
ncbi:hypothetical protein Salmuc_04691 [Salipiger mucosus DSM 16094]|uniref:TRAP transporter small permease protein n=1 Tax=Salipiger mucosus DSM 16094 TaxID=1123237 RepID=S9RFB8_9RHOB|nr:hypothetical protein Salmuc_04691 [Salipiger mucosus DSM 16094]